MQQGLTSSNTTFVDKKWHGLSHTGCTVHWFQGLCLQNTLPL